MSDNEQMQVEMLRARRWSQVVGLIQSFGVLVSVMLAGVGLVAIRELILQIGDLLADVGNVHGGSRTVLGGVGARGGFGGGGITVHRGQ